jgi:hypothetical protein
MHDQFMTGQGIKDRVNVQADQRVNQIIARNSADLNQANFFGIGMEAVRLGIDRYPAGRMQLRKESRQRVCTVNHGKNIWVLKERAIVY